MKKDQAKLACTKIGMNISRGGPYIYIYIYIFMGDDFFFSFRWAYYSTVFHATIQGLYFVGV